MSASMQFKGSQDDDIFLLFRDLPDELEARLIGTDAGAHLGSIISEISDSRYIEKCVSAARKLQSFQAPALPVEVVSVCHVHLGKTPNGRSKFEKFSATVEEKAGERINGHTANFLIACWLNDHTGLEFESLISRRKLSESACSAILEMVEQKERANNDPSNSLDHEAGKNIASKKMTLKEELNGDRPLVVGEVSDIQRDEIWKTIDFNDQRLKDGKLKSSNLDEAVAFLKSGLKAAGV